ncbi:MAG: hypothetical protein IKA38_08770, partial [Alistipes sp.]|nr:hypothetical protein [Alistipes sp.]
MQLFTHHIKEVAKLYNAGNLNSLNIFKFFDSSNPHFQTYGLGETSDLIDNSHLRGTLITLLVECKQLGRITFHT